MAAADHLAAAVEIHLAWGPERSIPVRDRFKAKLPPLSEADLAWLEAQCDAILSMACRLADAIGLEGLDPHEARRRMAAQWPTLGDQGIGRAMHQGYYSFWRDNGRGPEERPPAPKPRTGRPRKARRR